jgi:hypothetical protein
LGVSWEAFTLAVGRYWIADNAAFMTFLASATGRQVDLTTVEPATLAVFQQGNALRAIDLIAAGDIHNQVTRAVGHFFWLVVHDPRSPEKPGSCSRTPYRPFCGSVDRARSVLVRRWRLEDV